MGELVNRVMPTVEEDIDVDQEALTVDSQGSDQVNRDGSTQESGGVCSRDLETIDSPPKLLLLIEPPPKENLLKGIPAIPLQKKSHEPLIFGRGNDVDIFLNDETASRQHMKLFVLPSGVIGPEACFIAETISVTKPVYVNSQCLRNGEQKPLQTGDTLKIGQLKFAVRIISGDSQVCYEVEFVRQNAVNHLGFTNGNITGMAYGGVSNQPVEPVLFGIGAPPLGLAGVAGHPYPTNIGQSATPQGRIFQERGGVPQQPRYTPVMPSDAAERREVFHTQKQPSENSDERNEEASAKLPVEETGPPK